MSEKLPDHKPDCPKSRIPCTCGAAKLQSDYAGRWDEILFQWGTSEIDAEQAVLKTLETCDAVSDSLVHQGSCPTLEVACSCGASSEQAQAIAEWDRFKEAYSNSLNEHSL